MTVPSTRFREDYAGNGSATSFPYAFRIFKAADLVVTKTDNSGNETTLTLGTHYTVTGAGSYNGGAVVLTTALPTSYRLTIERVLAIRQDTDLRNQGEFLAETHEDAFDRLTMIVQRLAGYLGMGQGGTLRTLLLGTGDVDGAGAFRARGNRISGLGDPLDGQDAATKAWSETVLRQWQDDSGAALRHDLAQWDGATRIFFKHNNVESNQISLYQIASNFVIPHMFSSLQSMIDFAAATGKAIIFPAGTYSYATAPNFAKNNLVMIALGKVIFEHTGSGRAFCIDAGNSGSGAFNIEMIGDFAVKGNPNTDENGGVFVRAVHHSNLKIRAYDMPGAAFLVNFAVLTDMDFTCSVNQQAFSITPTKGIVLDKRNAGEYVADCRLNLVMEGVSGLGVDFVDVQGCFITGTTEGNASGFRDSATCADNTFVGFWCEANTSRDFELYGLRNRFINGKSISAVAGANCEVVTAVGTVFSGGFWRHVNLQSTSSGTLFETVALSDNPSLGITGSGSYKAINSYKVDTNGVKTGTVKDKIGEIGSWVPSLVGTGGTSAHYYGAREGSYYDIGNVRHFQARFTINTKDSGMTGSVSITGLDAVGAGTFASGIVGIHGNIATAGGRAQIGWYITNGSSSITLSNVNTGAADTLVDSSQIANGARIFISGSYII